MFSSRFAVTFQNTHVPSSFHLYVISISQQQPAATVSPKLERKNMKYSSLLSNGWLEAHGKLSKHHTEIPKPALRD